MHIKQITISNFRSYRQQPEVHPLSQHTNVVVGRNGSGKSNLFDAVQFVLLSPKFWTLRAEHRQSLLHEGSGSAAVNAFVEIIFDNSDNRFSIDSSSTSDEVVLRRTVGHKKDEFFLQRKRTNKHEVMSLLEGAGFSRSNPYFIVQQGRVNALCVMGDKERLRLLKEVAGTTVYDEKKEESLRKMEENRTNVEKINESLAFMEDRLSELRGEKEELSEYLDLDKKRKSIAFTLYDKELRKARETLDEIEHARADDVETRAVLFEGVRDTDNAITNIEAKHKTKTFAFRRNGKLVEGLEKDKRAAMTLRTKLTLQKDELQESINQNEKKLAFNSQELSRLGTEIKSVQTELQTKIQPQYEDTKDTLRRMASERDEARKKMDGLYEKQGRARHFQTVQERDTYLQTQIDEVTQAMTEKEAFLNEQRDALANLRRSHQTANDSLTKKQSEISKKTSALEQLQKQLSETKTKRHDLADQRKSEYWAQLDDLAAQISEARDSARAAHSALRKVTPRATAMGLEALVNHIVQEEGLILNHQYFGPVMDNFKLVDGNKFRTAVEVAAQNALFHVIVDTDETAARLMKRLEQGKLGRVTFLPLNQLTTKDRENYPNSSDVTPILQRCLKYDPKVHKAMQHVFGKKLLARSVDVASTWSAQCNMDAITLDGDLCSRKGSLTGGYVDHSKSRLKANSELKQADETLCNLQATEHAVKQKTNALDLQITKVATEIQRLEAKTNNLDYQLSQIDEDVGSQTRQLDAMDKQVHTIGNDVIPPIDTELKSLREQVNTLTAEMGTELTDTLTKDERNMLQNLKTVQADLERDMESHTQTLEEVGVKRQRLESLLEDNLLKRKRELEEGVVDDSKTNRRRSRGGEEKPASKLAQAQRIEDMAEVKEQLDEAIRTSDEVEQKLMDAKAVKAELRAELIKIKKDLEELRMKDTENKKAVEEAQKRDEKLMSKRCLCISDRERYMRSIQEIGTLPPTSELEKNKSSSISALEKKLESINKELKGYVHVNKKAYDQFINFSDKRDALLIRKKEVDREEEKVKELVESLDRQKDEAINRTFRGVSSHFKDVFKELVPNGAGKLVMHTSLDDEVDVDSEDGGGETDDEMDSGIDLGKKANSSPCVSRYRSIAIHVRFSNVGENYMMSQLSGGQKSLVALALIFAIQRCDPAPFYLFDELDQALDSTYRAAVATVIQKQANSKENPTQFICSTFRPELVQVADHCYGISHQDKVSSVHHLSKRDALKFIANLMSEEEAVGEVTSLPTSKASVLSRKRKALKACDEKEEDEVEESTSVSVA